jgi:hypothetical protein
VEGVLLKVSAEAGAHWAAQRVRTELVQHPAGAYASQAGANTGCTHTPAPASPVQRYIYADGDGARGSGAGNAHVGVDQPSCVTLK